MKNQLKNMTDEFECNFSITNIWYIMKKIELLSSLICDGNLICINEKDIYLENIDVSCVIFIKVLFHNTNGIEITNFMFGVNLSDLAKCLIVNKEDNYIAKFHITNKKLDVELTSEKNHLVIKRSLERIYIAEINVGILKTNYFNTILVNADMFNTFYLKESQSETYKIKITKNNKLRLRSKAKTGTTEYVLKGSNVHIKDEKLSILFAKEYLIKLFAYMYFTKDTYSIELTINLIDDIKGKYPLKIKSNDFIALLAPRIENSED